MSIDQVLGGCPPPSGTDIGAVVMEFLAAEPGRAARLLAQHVDDGTGHCRGCERAQLGVRDVWPCTIRRAVDEAGRLLRRRKASEQ